MWGKGGRRGVFRGGGEQHRRDGDQRGGNVDGKRGDGRADDHHAASEPDGHFRADRDVHGGRGEYGAVELSVAEERREHHRRHFGDLRHANHDNGGQRSDLRGGGEQHRRDGDQRGGNADGKRRDGRADHHHAASEPDGHFRADSDRSEERRVGKEGRSRWSPYH